jgi:plasmid stabilization system protein ParE
MRDDFRALRTYLNNLENKEGAQYAQDTLNDWFDDLTELSKAGLNVGDILYVVGEVRKSWRVKP